MDLISGHNYSASVTVANTTTDGAGSPVAVSLRTVITVSVGGSNILNYDNTRNYAAGGTYSPSLIFTPVAGSSTSGKIDAYVFSPDNQQLAYATLGLTINPDTPVSPPYQGAAAPPSMPSGAADLGGGFYELNNSVYDSFGNWVDWYPDWQSANNPAPPQPTPPADNTPVDTTTVNAPPLPSGDTRPQIPDGGWTDGWAVYDVNGNFIGQIWEFYGG